MEDRPSTLRQRAVWRLSRWGYRLAQRFEIIDQDGTLQEIVVRAGQIRGLIAAGNLLQASTLVDALEADFGGRTSKIGTLRWEILEAQAEAGSHGEER